MVGQRTRWAARDLKMSSKRLAISAGCNNFTREAASSIARGMPSSLRTT
jgi:hypothetical protein